MNAIRNDFAAKCAAANAEQWQAWRMGERESLPIALDAPETLDEAVGLALAGACFHPGDKLAVLYSHAGRNKRTLWLYAVKKSARNYSWRAAYDGGKPVKVCALEPVLLLQSEVASFQPVEPFDALRDGATGRDLALVDAK